MIHHTTIAEPYDNERGWENYDWLDRQSAEHGLSSFVWGLSVLGALALLLYAFVGYQETVISAVSQALR